MSQNANGPSAALRIGLWLVTAIVPSLAPEAQADFRIDVGGGAWLPFDSDERQVFGASPAVSVGMSMPLGSGATLAFLEAGYSHGSLREHEDSTFEADASYELLPVSLGLRFRAAGAPETRAALFLGVAWQTVFTARDHLYLPTESEPTFGLRLELRPEYRIGQDWILWLRQHLSLLANTGSMERSGVVDPSGSGLEMGLGIRLH